MWVLLWCRTVRSRSDGERKGYKEEEERGGRGGSGAFVYRSRGVECFGLRPIWDVWHPLPVQHSLILGETQPYRPYHISLQSHLDVPLLSFPCGVSEARQGTQLKTVMFKNGLNWAMNNTISYDVCHFVDAFIRGALQHLLHGWPQWVLVPCSTHWDTSYHNNVQW